MLAREIQLLPDYVFPAEEWRLVEKRFYPRLLGQTETLFAIANGYLGIRGTFEEDRAVRHRGTFVNGFHETWPIVYGENAYGFARTGQTMVNVPSGRILRLYVDDEPFDLSKATLLHYERALDMRSGTLTREVIWEKHSGKQIRIRSCSLVSFVHRHLAAIRYEVEMLRGDAPVVLSSELVHLRADTAETGDPRGTRVFKDPVLVPEQQQARSAGALLGFVTRNSGMRLACGMDHALECPAPYSAQLHVDPDRGRCVIAANLTEGQSLKTVKFLAYHVSRSAESDDLIERCDRSLDRVRTLGFEDLVNAQREYVQAFWHKCDVQVEGDPAIQQILRFNLFHILQATARAGGVGIPAKGLTGHGYEGHYFWDTEIFVLPFLIHTEPRIAKNLLRFRHRMLAQARQRAQEVNQRGALFPWRTINGEEASAYYAAGTAQYHINADVVYALRQYVEATGDEDFLRQEGAEILVETARLWLDLGFFSDNKEGQFCINGVTGPDEYNTVVNNNTYTNLMARENLRFAAASLRDLRTHDPSRFEELVRELKLEPAEIAHWQKAADRMFIPFDSKLGIHLQDDDFPDKKPWDFEGTPPDQYPLLLHFHPLVIYRHKVIKQADIVLAMFLLSHEFSLDQKRRNFDYYDPLTTGDSSLSVSIQSILAFELGYFEKAAQYTRYAMLMDLADIASNVDQGCHIACMGSTWMIVVHGVAGMREYQGRLSFRPRPGHHLKRLRFPLTYRGNRLCVDIHCQARKVTYDLHEGPGLEIDHEGEALQLRPGHPVTRPLAAAAVHDPATPATSS